MSTTKKNLIWLFFSKLIEWAFRKRGIARTLITAGISLIAVTMGVNWAGKLLYKDEARSLDLSVSTTDVFPSWVAWALLVFGIFILFIGGVFAVWDAWRDARASQRCQIVVVEVRGLHSSPDFPLENARMSALGTRHTVLIDFRPTSERELVNPVVALEKIAALKPTITALSKSANRSDVSIVVGGLAPVPTLVLVGAILDDESRLTTFDWDRSIGDWRETNEVDDGVRLRTLNVPTLGSGISEAVLAVSASYQISVDDLDAKFPSLPRLMLGSPPPLSADRFWSLEKQSAYVATIRDAIQQLTAAGITRIHMVLAAPSSLSLRIGMAYDRRLFAELVVYQYERQLSPPYPWGILLPSASVPAPLVIR